MKRSTVSVLVSAVALAGLCGCATSSPKSNQATPPAAQTTPPAQTAQAAPAPKPKKDKRPIEQRLVIGMTEDQVKTACGNPKNVAMGGDGSAVWMYNNSQNAWIPYYMESGGKIHTVTVYFDTSGKVKNWTATSNGMY